MNVTFNRESGMCTAQLEGEMTIYTAAEIKPMLLSLLDDCSEPEIDLSQVSEIDSAGLQLLLLAKREASRIGKSIRLVGHSPAVVECLDMCNLTALFGDQVVLSSQQKQ